MDPHQKKNQDLDLHQSDKLGQEPDPDRINLQMTGQNVWNLREFEHIFKGLRL
jgi:hypothetical protein